MGRWREDCGCSTGGPAGAGAAPHRDGAHPDQLAPGEGRHAARHLVQDPLSEDPGIRLQAAKRVVKILVIGSGAPVRCSCGGVDCWEAFSSERAAIARYLKLSCNSANARVTFIEVVDRALAGEANAKEALVETARQLGVGISNLIIGFSPEAVVVGGEIARAWDLIESALTETIANSVRRGLPSARILPSTLGEKPTLRGALSLVLASKFAAAFAA